MKTKSNRRWAISVLCVSAALLGCVAGLVAWVDPFICYHPPRFAFEARGGMQAYYNIGIARNMPYDALYLGSSMTENTQVSQVDQLFGVTCAKLPFEGGTMENYRTMLDAAFDTRDVSMVFLALDEFALSAQPDAVPLALPAYLYTPSVIDDVQYWFNEAVLTSHVPEALAAMAAGADPGINFDMLYYWGDRMTYGREKALLSMSYGPYGEELPREGDAQTVLYHLGKCLLPYVQAHPETVFVVYFPPYSILEWVKYAQAGTLARALYHRELVTQALEGYENVQLYDFQAWGDVVTDLDQYTDSMHHRPEINGLVVEKIAAGEMQANLKTVRDHNETILSMVESFTPPSEADLAQMRALIDE